MIQLPGSRIFIGTKEEADNIDSIGAIVHACQTSHYEWMDWNRTDKKPPKDHPNYLIREEGNIFSVNWVDGEARLYEWSGVDVFNKILDFMEKWNSKGSVLVHCDQAYSRSPMLGLIFLAKRLKNIPNDSYDKAKEKFLKIYPEFAPRGIEDFVKNNWDKIK